MSYTILVISVLVLTVVNVLIFMKTCSIHRLSISSNSSTPTTLLEMDNEDNLTMNIEFAEIDRFAEEDSILEELLSALSLLRENKAVKLFHQAAIANSPKLRTFAAEGLSYLNSQNNYDCLSLLADDEVTEVKIAAIHSLGHIQDKQAIPKLRSFLDHSCEEVHISATLALGNMGDIGVLSSLIELAIDDTAKLFHRVLAVMCLSNFETEDSISALSELLSVENEYVLNLHIIQSLGKIGNVGVVDKLIYFVDIEESNNSLLTTCIESIYCISPSKAVGFLTFYMVCCASPEQKQQVKSLDNSFFYDTVVEMILDIAICEDNNDSERIMAIKALGLLHAKKTVPKLLEIANCENSQISKEIIEVLGCIGEERLIELVLVLLEDSTYPHKEDIVFSLAKLGTPKAYDVLCKLSYGNHYLYLRNTVISAFGKLGDVRAYSFLVSILDENSDRQASICALRSLGYLGEEKAIPILQRYVLSEDSFVSRIAKISLNRLSKRTL